MCQDGWFGPFCSLSYNPCNSNRHNCSEGSTCVPLAAGYECDCPLGKTGRFCEKGMVVSTRLRFSRHVLIVDEQLSDISFTGTRSYIMVSPKGLNAQDFSLQFELRPLSDSGFVLYLGILEEDNYLACLLQGNSLEVRISSGKFTANNTIPLIVRSSKLLATGIWQPVKITITGRQVVLAVNGVVNRGMLDQAEAFTLFQPSLFIGE